jgi:hypothetical protein
MRGKWYQVPMAGIGLVLLALAFFLHVYIGMGCGVVLILASLFGTSYVTRDKKK